MTVLMIIPGAFTFITITIGHNTTIFFVIAVRICTSNVAISKPFIRSSCTVFAFCYITIVFNRFVLLSYANILIVLVLVDYVSVYLHILQFNLYSFNIINDTLKGNLSFICQL